ncbi:MAG: hypothetical protein ACRDYV_07360, partial [Acidimicrobiia bacterium]
MPRRTLVIDAPVPEVRRAAEGGALAAIDDRDSGVLSGAVPFGSGEPVPLGLRLTAGLDGTTEVELETPDPASVPYFGWFVRPVMASANRRALTHAAAVLQAGVAGQPSPPPPRRPPLAPPANFDT